MSASEVRLKLRKRGFAPIPVSGKVPPLKEWGKRADTSDGDIEIWEKLFPQATNTGILTALAPCLDIDILDPAAADAAEEAVRERFEEHGDIRVRFGRSPKRCVFFRTNEDERFKKITVNLVAPNGDTEQKIELLADGQQAVVDGIHPGTNKPYTWFGGSLCEADRETLPYIREAEARELVDAVIEALAQHGYRRAASRPTRARADNGHGAGGAADWSYLFDNVRDGRDLHDTLRDLAAKLIASGTAAGAAVNQLRALMQASTAPRDARWEERYDDIPRAVSSAEEKYSEHADTAAALESTVVSAPTGPLAWLNMSSWDSVPLPERRWAIRDRTPAEQAGLFSGVGGTGKSIIELMKNVAHVAGKDWLGSMPEPGPAFYLGAEDAEDEIHIRLDAIAEHYGVTFKELVDGGLHILPLLGKDATLCAMSRGGRVEVTALYRQIYEAAGDIKPKNISIDTLSRAFAGNEIDRVQVYAFCNHMQALAMVTGGGSVTVLSHPSLSGIASGSGISGSTAWHGAFRFRQYLIGSKPDNGEQADDDLRELQFMKNQYGPRGETMVLRYQRGLFLPEGSGGSLAGLARSAKAEQVFLDLLRRFTSQDRNVSDKRNAPNYAPTEFAREDDARKFTLKRLDLEQAMRSLFKADKITVYNYGRPSRPQTRIVLK